MGSCQASVRPASAISSTPLTIITEATNRRTARRGLVRCLVTAGKECRPVSEGTGTLTALRNRQKEAGSPPMANQMSPIAEDAPTANPGLLSWVEEVAQLTQPDSIHWCDGSAEEYDQLCSALVEAGTFEKLDEAQPPHSYLFRPHPGGVARVEDRPLIFSQLGGQAGPTHKPRGPRWMEGDPPR